MTALKVNHSLETIGDGGDQVPDHHLVLIKLLILATTQGEVLFCPPENLLIFVKLGLIWRLRYFFTSGGIIFYLTRTILCFKNLLKWNSFNIHLSHSLTHVPAILCFVVLVVFSFFKITPLIYHQIEQVGTVLNAEFNGLPKNDITFCIWWSFHWENYVWSKREKFAFPPFIYRQEWRAKRW